MACAGRGLSWRTVGTSSAQARSVVRAGVQTVELEEAPCDDRNGTRSAPSADHRGVDRHRRPARSRAQRVAPADRAGRAAVRRALPRSGARGRAGGDDGLAVRRRGVRRGRRAGASGRAGRDRRAARDQEARQERSRRRAPSARAADGRPAAGIVDPARAPARPARAGQAAPHARRCSAASGSSACRRCSITTASRRAAGCSAPSRAPGSTGLQLPPAAREQITIALAMIDAHDAQLVPLDQELREYAKPPARLPGADAPLRDRAADVDHDPRRARRRAPLQLLARGRPLRRPGHHRPPIRRAPRPRPPLPPRTRRRCAGRSSKPPNAPAGPARPTTTTTCRRPSGSAATAPAWPSRASSSSAASTPCANSARRPWRPHDHPVCARCPHHADAPRPAPGMLLPPPPRGRPS